MDAPKIFWSWQNDYAPDVCRHFIRKALLVAVEAAGDELGLEDAERPEVDHDTMNAPGMVDIIATILAKITQSAVFVADVTPVAKSVGGKALPNPNVLVELGWAMKAIGPERIIAIINTASGFNADDLPFDIRHRRILSYNLRDDAIVATRAAVTKNLVAELTDALKINLAGHMEEMAAAQEIRGVPAKLDNPSVWATAKDRIESHDSFVTGWQQSVAFPGCPRAYIRVIPAGWKKGVPSVNEIARLPDSLIVWPPLEGGGGGTFGTCEEGFVRYWFTGGNEKDGFETRNVTMFFDTTGEFWTVHGTAIAPYRNGLALRNEAVIHWWARAIKGAFAAFDRFGANPARLVEAGLVGVRGVRWPGQWESSSPPARKDSCVASRQSRDWDGDAQVEFLTEAYATITDLFGLPPPNSDYVRQIINKPM